MQQQQGRQRPAKRADDANGRPSSATVVLTREDAPVDTQCRAGCHVEGQGGEDDDGFEERGLVVGAREQQVRVGARDGGGEQG